MERTFLGDCKNKQDITLHTPEGDLEVTWKENIPVKNDFYVVVKSKMNLGEYTKGQPIVFSFDGDLGTMRGNYTTVNVATHSIVLGQFYDMHPEEAEQRSRELEEEKKPEPKPQPKPEPKPQPKPKPRPQSANNYSSDDDGTPEYYVNPSHQITTEAAPNEGHEGWLKARNVFYIIGVIFGFATIAVAVILALSALFRTYSGQDGAAALIPSAIAIVVAMTSMLSIFAISSIGAISAFKNRDDVFHKSHSAVIVLGLINFNILAMLGGWFNYRYRVSRYKIKPVDE